jgi:hypothetical protein
MKLQNGKKERKYNPARLNRIIYLQSGFNVKKQINQDNSSPMKPKVCSCIPVFQPGPLSNSILPV